MLDTIKIAVKRIINHPYEKRHIALQYLSPDAAVQIAMTPNEVSRPTGNLYKIWKDIEGGHKWWHYFDIYETLLAALKSRPIRFLEIGVYKGGSLEMWKRYLHPESIIVGIDIDPSCKQFDRPRENVHVRIGSQSDTRFLNEVVIEFGRFDVIIDDGSHNVRDMIQTFNYAFLNALKSRGLYLAEDTHSNFWREHRDQQYSFLDLCKDLVDLSHSHYMLNRINEKAFRYQAEDRLQSISTARIGSEIEEIRFFDSVVAIQRHENRPLPTSEHL